MRCTLVFGIFFVAHALFSAQTDDCSHEGEGLSGEQMPASPESAPGITCKGCGYKHRSSNETDPHHSFHHLKYTLKRLLEDLQSIENRLKNLEERAAQRDVLTEDQRNTLEREVFETIFSQFVIRECENLKKEFQKAGRFREQLKQGIMPKDYRQEIVLTNPTLLPQILNDNGSIIAEKVASLINSLDYAQALFGPVVEKYSHALEILAKLKSAFPRSEFRSGVILLSVELGQSIVQ
jgi:hypothetical protein